LARIADSGLTISSVQPRVHTVYPDSLEPEPARPEERMALVRTAIERIGPHAPEGTPFVVNTGAAPGGDFQQARDTALREFTLLSDFAAHNGFRIALEPLNPISMNKSSFIWSLPQALAIAGEIGRDNFGLCVDCWNIWQDPLMAQHIEQCGNRIFVVQVSDWHTPRSFADRGIVGSGEIPLTQFLRAVHAAGYEGAVTLEIFSDDSLPDSLWRSNGNDVILRSKEALTACWELWQR